MSDYNDIETFTLSTTQEILQIIKSSQKYKQTEILLLSDPLVDVIKRFKSVKDFFSFLDQAIVDGLLPKNLYNFIKFPVLDGDDLGDDTLGGGDTFGEDDVIIEDVNPTIDDTTLVDTTNTLGLGKGNIKYIIAFSKNNFKTTVERANISSVSLETRDKTNIFVGKASLSLDIEKNDTYSTATVLSKEIINLAIEK